MEIWKPFGPHKVGICELEFGTQKINPDNVDPKNVSCTADVTSSTTIPTLIRSADHSLHFVKARYEPSSTQIIFTSASFILATHIHPSKSHLDYILFKIPLQHLTGRLYYPCQGKRPFYQLIRRGVSWLPGYNYAAGLSYFLFFRRPKGWMYTIAKQMLTVISFAFGKLQLMDFYQGAPLAHMPDQLPVVVFSHGLGGHRGVYAITASELASQGYLVLAVEHADGTSSCAKLAGGSGYRFYKGLGTEEQQVSKTRHRIEEMKTARKILLAMHRGDKVEGLKLSHNLDARTFLKGNLDFKCLAAIGHSYGGATVTGLVSEDPLYRCAVCFDPWWYALPPESSALTRWQTRAPILILGSHDWNVPNAFGELMCGEERQAAIMEAAKVNKSSSQGNNDQHDGVHQSGGGALLCVISGSSHNTYADPLALFSEHVGWILRALGLTARLDPVLGIHLVNTATLNFLSRHLPLTEKQRQVQTWTPSKGHNALDKILENTEADAGRGSKGVLSWMFPGRGLLNAMSDTLINKFVIGPPPPRNIKTTTTKPDGAAVNGSGSTALKADTYSNIPTRTPLSQHQQTAAITDKNQNQKQHEPPEDIVTGEEIFESAMPSADPASGQHSHAPGRPTTNTSTSIRSEQQDEEEKKKALLAGAGVTSLSEKEREVIRMGIGSSHSGSLSGEDVKDYVALLGEEHLFKLVLSV